MNHPEKDALSLVLARLHLQANVFLHQDFCGTWAVNTSGSRKMPFHLIEQGTAWLHLGQDEPQQLTAGSFILFPHDDTHIVSSDPTPPPAEIVNDPGAFDSNGGRVTSMICGYFEFAGKAVWPLLDTLPGTIFMDLDAGSSPVGTRRLLRLLTDELHATQPAMTVAVDQLSLVLFIQVLRNEIDRGLEPGLLQAFCDRKIGHALGLIHAEPGADWSVERLAREVNMSRTAFAERFKELTRLTPMRYVTEWRMQEAIDLLQTTDFSVAQIAERCGYGSEVAFRKAVRNVTGHPPGDFRRRSTVSFSMLSFR